jgi:hypothetical protein
VALHFFNTRQGLPELHTIERHADVSKHGRTDSNLLGSGANTNQNTSKVGCTFVTNGEEIYGPYQRFSEGI